MSVNGLSLMPSSFASLCSARVSCECGGCACIGRTGVAHCAPCAGLRDHLGNLEKVAERPSLPQSWRPSRPEPVRARPRTPQEIPVSDKVTHVGDADFDAAVLQSGEPVLVDFWAEWCGPCKMISPVLDELAETYGGKLKVAKVNVDENRATAIKYHVRSIPMLLLFKDGQIQATQIGAVGKGQLTQMIDKALGTQAA